ncbi:Chromate resistance protein ChrB [Arthrobacter sp. H5]|uniref:Chromate resistance protein ChrB n=1 Tax=Arthrobacter sp. H5 TaxID=1267973 RepID=UPI0006868DAC|nr:Chromate resistance protein ChrB [Arthrobacter sp. H5]
MVANLDRLNWVLLSYRIPRTPSTARIAVWRKLQRLGVAQIGDGVVALPEDARTREQLEWIAEQIEEAHGAATVWRAQMTSATEEHRLITAMAQARTEEYQAIIAEATAARGTEMGSGSRVLAKLRRDLRQVRRRDYFPPVEAGQARLAVEDLAGGITYPESMPAGTGPR